MNNLIVILLIVSLLGGFAIKFLKESNGLSSMFSSMGFKSKEQLEKEQLDKYMGKFLKNQGQYIQKSKESVQGFGSIIQKASEKENGQDMLRIRSLMEQFADQNNLMVEDGNKLIEMQNEQKKINAKMAHDGKVAEFLSSSKANEVLDRQRDALEKQRELLDQMQSQLKNSSLGLGTGDKLADNIDSLRQKNEDLINDIKNDQSKIKDFIADRTGQQRQKIEDMRIKNQDALERARSSSQNASMMNDRIKDQMQRYKDKMNR